MPPKRPRRSSPAPAGLSAGERLKRARLAGQSRDYSAWGWVGDDAAATSEITPEHRLATCGFAQKSIHPLCANKYSPAAQLPRADAQQTHAAAAGGELEDDVIVISDDEGPECSSKACKANPYCLNYLGQEKWENKGAQAWGVMASGLIVSWPDKALEAFLKAADLGEDPVLNSRDPGAPVGLKVRYCLPLSFANTLLT